MFVFASFANMLAPLVLGIVLDTFGPRTCSTISIIFILIGSALFSFSDTEHFNLFIPAMCMISFGGPGTQTAIIHLSNLFPQWKATTTAIITGSFQLSFFVFFIFDQLWLFLKIDFRSLFMGYCVVCIINAIISLTLWPDTPYTFDELLHDPPEGEEEVDESEVFMLSILFSFIHFITILLTLHKLHLGIIRLPSQFFHHSPKIGSPRVEERLFLERRSPTRELKVEELTNIKDFTLLQQVSCYFLFSYQNLVMFDLTILVIECRVCETDDLFLGVFFLGKLLYWYF